MTRRLNLEAATPLRATHLAFDVGLVRCAAAVFAVTAACAVPACSSSGGKSSAPATTTPVSATAAIPAGAHTVVGACGSTTLHQGASWPWTGPARAPDGLVQATGDNGLAVAYLFAHPLRSGHPDERNNKILWVMRKSRNGSDLVITAQPLGESTPTVTVRRPPDSRPGEIYPSIVDVPSPGCWHFTLTWDGNTDHVDLPYEPQ